ncbi:hypothetical protein KM043_006747 [Ampulex compressa]|nr:hypothetical protein KM043_006747 [Ampulex compressa]
MAGAVVLVNTRSYPSLRAVTTLVVVQGPGIIYSRSKSVDVPKAATKLRPPNLRSRQMDISFIAGGSKRRSQGVDAAAAFRLAPLWNGECIFRGRGFEGKRL